MGQLPHPWRCPRRAGVGTAVVAAVITSNSPPQGLPTDDAFTYGFWVCAGVAVLAVVASLVLPSMRRRHELAVTAGVEDLPSEPAGLHPHADEKARA